MIQPTFLPRNVITFVDVQGGDDATSPALSGAVPSSTEGDVMDSITMVATEASTAQRPPISRTQSSRRSSHSSQVRQGKNGSAQE